MGEEQVFEALAIKTAMPVDLPEKLRVEATLMMAAFGGDYRGALALSRNVLKLLQQCPGDWPTQYAEEFSFYKKLAERTSRIARQYVV